MLIVNYALCIVNCFAVCPPGWTEIDAGALYTFHASACPAGYSEISSPIILPSPAGGSDAKGTFVYDMCGYQ